MYSKKNYCSARILLHFFLGKMILHFFFWVNEMSIIQWFRKLMTKSWTIHGLFKKCTWVIQKLSRITNWKSYQCWQNTKWLVYSFVLSQACCSQKRNLNMPIAYNFYFYHFSKFYLSNSNVWWILRIHFLKYNIVPNRILSKENCDFMNTWNFQLQ